MLNEEIVKAGYANVMTIPPNVKYQDRFLKAYRGARERKRGLWGKGLLDERYSLPPAKGSGILGNSGW